MYRSNPVSHSILKQQQPQRYSDRHQLQRDGPGEDSPCGPLAALQQDVRDQTKRAGDGSYEGSREDEQGIKSYLKKTDMTEARAAKPDRAIDAFELKWSEKEGPSDSKLPAQ